MKYIKYVIIVMLMINMHHSKAYMNNGGDTAGVMCLHNGSPYGRSSPGHCPLPDPNSHMEMLNNPHSDANDPKCILSEAKSF